MLEVKAVYFVLLAEGFGVSVLAVILMIAWRLRIHHRKRKAVAQLVSQIKHQSEIRIGKTSSFLQDIYDFDNEELKHAVETVDRQEKKIFQKIIKMFLNDDAEIVTGMDAALTELIETYKALKPIVPEGQGPGDLNEALLEIETLKSENENLKRDLEISRAKVEG